MSSLRRFGFIFSIVGLTGSALAAPGCAAAPPADESSAEADSLARGDRYYAVVFGYENTASDSHRANEAPYSHTFATFVHASAPSDLPPSILEHVDISWLPSDFTGSVCADAIHLRCGPEDGHDYTLDETLDFARSMRDRDTGESMPRRLAAWGPYAIDSAFFTRAKQQRNFLTSPDRPNYIANDLLYHVWAYRRASQVNGRGPARPLGANNCIHAVTDMVQLETQNLQWGIKGSLLAINTLRANLHSRDMGAEWIAQELGFDADDIERDPTE